VRRRRVAVTFAAASASYGMNPEVVSIGAAFAV
jgi:hypothetical protein